MTKKERRLTAKDFDQRILDLYDHYAHGKITKRDFLKSIGKYTATGVTALSVFTNQYLVLLFFIIFCSPFNISS